MAIVNGWRLKYKVGKKKKKHIPEVSKSYKGRKKSLSRLGYTSYQEYLESDDWKVIRADKIRRFPKCLLCQGKATQVHHMDYGQSVLLGIYRQALVTLCDPCHVLIEFDGPTKRTLHAANEELMRLAAEKGLSNWINYVRSVLDPKKRRDRDRTAFICNKCNVNRCKPGKKVCRECFFVLVPSAKRHYEKKIALRLHKKKVSEMDHK